MDPQLKSILIGVAAAVLIDINSFIAARLKDPTAKYDIVLFVFRALQGAILGTIGANIPTS